MPPDRPPTFVAASTGEPGPPEAGPEKQAREIQALRASLQASSARVHELDTALATARELLELRARQAAEHGARIDEALSEISRLRRRVVTLRRRLVRRERSLRQAAKRAQRLEAIERSPVYRAAQRGASWPVVGGLVRRGLPRRR